MQKPICNSDHVGIKIVFRAGKLKQPIRQQWSIRDTLAQHDRAELWRRLKGAKHLFKDKCNASIAETIENGGTCIEAIHTACAKAAATLPRKTRDPNANWFSMFEVDMMATIGKRNAAKKKHEQAPSAAS
jgi:hypothetical protein